MFSQNQEEQHILKYFESPAGNTKIGTLLSIGENDGITLSNSRALILAGWEAVLIEPDPEAVTRLRILYRNNPRVSIHQMGIGGVDEVKPFYSVGSHLGKGDTGLLSTFNLEELQTRFPGAPYTEHQIELMTWKSFYAHAPGPKIFNFISIDAESMDLNILRQIDFTETKTSAVCVEWNSKDRHLYDQVMYKFRFNLIYVSPENLLYAR